MKTGYIKISHLALMAALTSALVGCSTVSVPKVDFSKVPEFIEEASNIKDYPRASDAPAPPTELRSAKDWDTAAEIMIEHRDSLPPALAGEPETPDITPEEAEALKQQVKAYKLDDPPEGIQ